jgi:hypothetical protein
MRLHDDTLQFLEMAAGNPAAFGPQYSKCV